jgi:isoleucyl-tRNA synthetase
MSRFSPVDKRLDHVALEHRVLERWQREGTFEALRAQNRGGPAYSFVDGPITANNPMGVHHAWGRTLKDLWQRYHAMLGCELRYQNGFDCQGLWVEVEVEKALGLNSKPEIEQYGIDRFARACRDRVATYADVQRRQSERLGQWMDWECSYFTMTDTNISYIWGFLKTCHERDWLYRGHRSMPWCPRCGTSLSQHELIDSYREITHPSLHVRLPLHGRDREYLVVWTTTPWTLPANVAAAVLPDADYARVQTAAGIAHVAAARLEHTPLKGTVVGTVKGSELVGRGYDGPFDDLPAQQGVEHRVVAWEDVSMDEGTGIVHIAPGCGAEDFELGKREGLATLVPVDESGAFVDGYGWLHGRHTADAAQVVVEELGQRAKLVEAGEITHRYPVCWRCGTELIYRLVDEWFIRCDQLRQPMIDASAGVQWMPPQYGKRMEDWLRNMGDWCISRKRYWGLPLPFYFCPDGHMTVVGSKHELAARALRGFDAVEELHRPWIDEVAIACDTCGAEATRLLDVGDCWLDAGIVPFSTLGWGNPEAIPEGYAEGAGVGLTKADLPSNADWERWFPADWICEMREQVRLWFYSMLFMSVALIGEAPYRRVLVHEKVNDETGRPMHKSWGNAIWFDEAVENMGADVMRWMYALQTPGQNLSFGYGPAAAVKAKLLTLWNTYAFFVGYAEIEDFVPDYGILGEGPATARPLDRWLVAVTQELVAEAREALDTYDSPRLVRAFERYVRDDLSNWYVRSSRVRFWRSDDAADTRAAFETLWYALVQAIRVIAPVMPFLADEIWQNLVRGVCPDAPESVHLAGYPEVLAGARDPGAVAAMASARAVVELGHSARNDAGVKLRQPLAEVIVATDDPQRREHVSAHADLIGAELGVKGVRLATSSEDFAEPEVMPNLKLLGPKYGRDLGVIRGMLREGEFSLTGGGTVEVGGWTLEPGEYELRTRAREGFAVADGEGFAVALDTEITPELALEGVVRDVIRQVQVMRKDAGLELTDRIRVTYPRSDGDTTRAFAEHGDWISAEVLAVALEPGDGLAIARA